MKATTWKRKHREKVADRRRERMARIEKKKTAKEQKRKQEQKEIEDLTFGNLNL